MVSNAVAWEAKQSLAYKVRNKITTTDIRHPDALLQEVLFCHFGP